MESYAALPYDARPLTMAHPDRLGVLARLFGVAASPPERSRILDLGCADGSHLLALALEYPECRCLGVDASAEQIAAGRKAAAELGATNLSLEVADFGAALEGEFDYISAHGVLSWVDASARERLLATVGRCLAPGGVAYLSYEVLPGSMARLTVRNVLMPYVEALGSAAMGPRFRALAKAFAEALPDQARNAPLKAELARAARSTDSAVAHDWCSGAHEALSFRDFAALLARHDLEYVTDTPLMRSSAACLTAAGRRVLAEIDGDVVERQQAIDIVSNNAYRQSLVVRAGTVQRAEPELESELGNARLSAFASVEASGSGLRMKNHLGQSAVMNDPAMQAAVVALTETSPLALECAELVAQCEARLGKKLSAAYEQALLRGVFELVSAGFVDARRTAARCVARAGERPTASALARWQSSRASTLTNQAHYAVQVAEERARALLQLLDGKRERGELGAAWGQGTTEELSAYLQRFAKLGLLVA